MQFSKFYIMEKIIIVIEASKDSFSAYSENVSSIYGAGATIKECKNSILEAIEIYKEPDMLEFAPKILLDDDYTITYKYDVQSILAYYSGIFTKAGLERITGINQKQLGHYASGLKKPRPAQQAKIIDALHRLGEDLISLQLYKK